MWKLFYSLQLSDLPRGRNIPRVQVLRAPQTSPVPVPAMKKTTNKETKHNRESCILSAVFIISVGWDGCPLVFEDRLEWNNPPLPYKADICVCKKLQPGHSPSPANVSTGSFKDMRGRGMGRIWKQCSGEDSLLDGTQLHTEITYFFQSFPSPPLWLPPSLLLPLPLPLKSLFLFNWQLLIICIYEYRVMFWFVCVKRFSSRAIAPLMSLFLPDPRS